jgi:VWFA-related protein
MAPKPYRRLYSTALVAVASTLLAQQFPTDEIHLHSSVYWPSTAATIRAQSNLVEVAVVVRDGKGNAVPGLEKKDFLLWDSGKSRDIQTFSVESRSVETPPSVDKTAAASPAGTAAPSVRPARARLISLTFDDRSIEDADMRRIKEAAKKFVRESLAPGDRVAVVSIAFPQTVTFLSDPDELVKKIEAIKPQPRMTGAGLSICPTLTPYESYLIANGLDNQLLAAKQQEYRECLGGVAKDVTPVARRFWELGRSNSEDTLRSLWGVVDAMANLPGERVVLLASSGFLTGDLEMLEEDLISRALRAGVVVNTLEARGLFAYTPGPSVEQSPRGGSIRAAIQLNNAAVRLQGLNERAIDDGLAVLALGTGGRFFENNNDLAAGLRAIGAVPEVVYVLGFSPGDIPHDGRYRPLKVRLTAGHHDELQARPGYSAPLKDEPPPVAPTELDREVFASDIRAELPVKIQAGPSALPDGGTGIAMVVKVNVELLGYRLRDDRKTQKVVMVAALLDTHGAFVAGKREDLDLSLTRETFAKLARSGVEATLTVKASPGSYTLRAVVCDDMGLVTALSRPIELR